jgi:hypothetical protein
MAEQLTVAERLHGPDRDDAFISGFLEVIGEARRLQETLEAPARRHAARKSRLTTAGVIGILSFTMYVFYLSWLPPDEQRPFPVPQADLFGAAHSACKQFVSGSLEAPATADFAGRFSRATSVSRPTRMRPEGGWRYEVASHVDAQNRFGATVRTRFRCRVTWDGERWEVDDLQTSPWAEAVQ